MDFIKGFKSVTYNELQEQLKYRFERSGKTLPQLAIEADLASTEGVRNTFYLDEQKVSDKTLTSVFNSIGLNAFVVWINGERRYMISTKINY